MDPKEVETYLDGPYLFPRYLHLGQSEMGLFPYDKLHLFRETVQ